MTAVPKQIRAVADIGKVLGRRSSGCARAVPWQQLTNPGLLGLLALTVSMLVGYANGSGEWTSSILSNADYGRPLQRWGTNGISGGGGSVTQCFFILSAFDQNLWCTILECRFSVEDVGAMRDVFEDDGDFEPGEAYTIERSDVEAINRHFSINFPLSRLPSSKIEFCLLRGVTGQDAVLSPGIPYLVHTNFELPLMLDGRKKLARFPNMWPQAEAAFDRWVEEGVLHKEVIIKPVPEALKRYAVNRSHSFDREVYYTLKGEEWRIPAMELVWAAGTGSNDSGWTEHHERIEGMLFGYEPWQNSWWIENANKTNGGIGGIPFCGCVDAHGLEWIKSAGYKALPPSGSEEFCVRLWNSEHTDGMASFLEQDPNSVALVRFKLLPKGQREFFPVGKGKAGPYLVKRRQVPAINRLLKRDVDIVLTR